MLDCYLETKVFSLFLSLKLNQTSDQLFFLMHTPANYGAVSTPKIKVQLDDMMVDILNTLLCLQDTMVWPHN